MIKRAIFLLVTFIEISIFSIPADVKAINNEKYFPCVLKAIQNAKESIYGSFYYISYSDKGPVKKILTALIKAVQKGVKVEIVLDREYESIADGDLSKKNIKAFSFLKKNGISVFYDDIETLSHSKYWIIDKTIVISGSFNLSNKSLMYNRESAFYVESVEIAEEFLKDYQIIPKTTPEPVAGAIPIPREFMTNPDLASIMIQKQREIAFEFYLLLNKLSYERKSGFLEIEESIIEDYFIKWKDIKRDRPIISFFTKSYLSKRDRKSYPFIKVFKHDNTRKKLTVELDKENTGKPEALWLSELYWKDGWFKRLTLREKFCYLYLLLKTDSGRMGRHFEQMHWKMTEECNLRNEDVFSYGFTALKRLNLIEKEVRYQPGEQIPNSYILNDFYVYSDLEKKFQQLKEITDSEIFKLSYEICDLTDEPQDLDAIKKVIVLGEKYGSEVLKETIKVIKKESKRSTVSRYKRYNYVLGVIKAKGEGIPKQQ